MKTSTTYRVEMHHATGGWMAVPGNRDYEWDFLGEAVEHARHLDRMGHGGRVLDSEGRIIPHTAASE